MTKDDQIEIKHLSLDLALGPSVIQKIELVKNATLAQVTEAKHQNLVNSPTRCKAASA